MALQESNNSEGMKITNVMIYAKLIDAVICGECNTPIVNITYVTE